MSHTSSFCAVLPLKTKQFVSTSACTCMLTPPPPNFPTFIRTRSWYEREEVLSESKTAKRRVGRLHKWIGDTCLLLGSPKVRPPAICPLVHLTVRLSDVCRVEGVVTSRKGPYVQPGLVPLHPTLERCDNQPCTAISRALTPDQETFAFVEYHSSIGFCRSSSVLIFSEGSMSRVFFY